MRRCVLPCCVSSGVHTLLCVVLSNGCKHTNLIFFHSFSVSGHRGMDQLVFGLEDVMRGCEMGLRSILSNDWGLLYAVDEMKKAGKLPSTSCVCVCVCVCICV